MSIKTLVSLLLALGLSFPARADAPPELPREMQALSEATLQPEQANPPVRARPVSSRWAPKHLPRGDLRHCLELHDNLAIIRCAEKRR